MNGSTNGSAISNLYNHNESFAKRCIPIWTKKETNTELIRFKKLIEKKYNQRFNTY
nr:BLTX320 [Nephila pilipes]